MKGEWHFAGYLYETECACPTGRWSVFPPSFKSVSGCLITMDVFSLRFFVGIRVIIVVEGGVVWWVICRVPSAHVGTSFPALFHFFCNFITMDMFSMGFSLVFELL